MEAQPGTTAEPAINGRPAAPQPRPSLLPAPYEIGVAMDNGELLPYDLSKVLALHHSRAARCTSVNLPPGIDPAAALQERENRISSKIAARIEHLITRPVHIPYEHRVASNIELRALRLVNFQAQIRSEVMNALKTETTLLTAIHPFAYRRTKRQSLREARVTEKLEKHRKIETERKKRQEHADMLNAIMQHAKVFKEFHRNKALSIMKTRRAVATYHQNSEIQKKKEEERKERERMQLLKDEDEAGYRALLDEKKDKRLVHLLEQTDEFIKSLTSLVKSHQSTEKKKKREERKAAEAAAGINQPPPEGAENGEHGENGTNGTTAPPAEVDSDDEEEHRIHHEDNGDDLEGLTEEEKAKRILEKARNEEDEYDPKTKRQMDDYFSIAHRKKERIFKQHTSMGGGDPTMQLKQYQIRGLEWMVSLYNNNLNGILADEMGLGKTIQTISLITYLMEIKENRGPYLVIVPLSTMSNWKMEFEKWAPNVKKVVYKGDKEQRRLLDREVRRGDFNVLLTTYEYVQREKALLGKIHWKYMIIDEGHRLKNDKGQLTLILNSHFRAQHRLLLTGTPLQNKLPELWALLNFLLPTIFSSCGTFDAWFNAPFESTGEKAVLSPEETMLIIRRLHKVLRPFLLRRLKKEVESQLPDKTEHVIKCDMSALQHVLYKHMQKGLLIDGKQQAGGKALANTVMHLRKLCNHPFLFPSVEESCKKAWGLDDYVGDEIFRVAGKFELLDKILPKLQATGHRILIFSQMVEAMNILADYFEYRQWKYLRLDGSTNHEDRGELLRLYNAPGSEYWLFMLSTRAGGLGLNLQTADTVIIFDSDWNPAQDMQAMDRAHRIGQKKEVRVLRLITANSVEEKILAAARHKMNIDEKVIQAGKFDQKSTGEDRRKMLELIIKADQDDKAADDIPDDEMINQLIARSEEEFDTYQSMDIDRRREEASQLHRKPRLVEENEIPDDITKASEAAVVRQAEDEARGGAREEVVGRRKRKAVDYSIDSMSDEAFLREIGEDVDGIEQQEEEEDRSKKSKRAKRKVIIEEDDEDMDENGTSTDTNGCVEEEVEAQ